MTGYILRRAIGVVPVLLIASILIFMIIHFIPGDPVLALLPENPTELQIQSIREIYGFNDSLPVQYLNWLRNLLSGNLGNSIRNGWPVSQLIVSKMGVTVQLAVVVFIFAFTIALPLGIAAGLRPDGWVNRRFLGIYTAFGFAMPTFWLGILLIILFGVQLGVLPTSGFRSLFDDPWIGIRYLILPGLTQAIPGSVVYSNFIASAVADVRRSEYVTFAVAKGMPPHVVLLKHTLKNGMIPVVTIAAVVFGQTMAGAVITESVFGIPGLGQLLVQSITARDYAVLQANLMFLVVVFVAASFAADLINAWLDPRVRYD